ncbi:MAG TPA: enoyl-CoA hydratase-related protein, partial [Thermoleophilaceae bacterium]|nr:enoyl-CoA hydratase-related protein [Thermoleophilaceae bacterium]
MASVATSAGLRTLTVSDVDRVARVTLDRPEKRNALSLELMDELVGALKALGGREDIRTIVLEGAGSAFSAGHDLSEMVGRDLSFYQRLFDSCT